MSSSHVLRPARHEDLTVLLPLVRAFYSQFGYPYAETEKRRLLAQVLDTPSLGSISLVLSETGDPVGYLFLSYYFSLEFGGRTAFIDEFFVDPAYRGHGLGSRALRHEIERARVLGIRALQLEAERSNIRASALYSRLGFVDHDRHLMTCVLDPAR